MASSEKPIVQEKPKKYESLFEKLDNDKWEKNKHFAQEYDSGNYETKTNWNLFFKNVASNKFND